VAESVGGVAGAVGGVAESVGAVAESVGCAAGAVGGVAGSEGAADWSPQAAAAISAKLQPTTRRLAARQGEIKARLMRGASLRSGVWEMTRRSGHLGRAAGARRLAADRNSVRKRRWSRLCAGDFRAGRGNGREECAPDGGISFSTARTRKYRNRGGCLSIAALGAKRTRRLPQERELARPSRGVVSPNRGSARVQECCGPAR
jgi:hypothetical protein